MVSRIWTCYNSKKDHFKNFRPLVIQEKKNSRAMSFTFYFLRGVKKVLLHTYVVAGRRLLQNTVSIVMYRILFHYMYFVITESNMKLRMMYKVLGMKRASTGVSGRAKKAPGASGRVHDRVTRHSSCSSGHLSPSLKVWKTVLSSLRPF